MKPSLLLLGPLALMSAGGALAQGAIPDAHWGAYSFPSSVPEIRGGLHFNRFTQFSSTSTQFNEIEESAGFNFLVGSYTDRLTGAPHWTYTSAIGIGISSDEPTQFLQNEFVHKLNPQGEVPIGSDREEIEFLGAFSMTRWFEPSDRLGQDLFIGGGVATSTLFHEPWAHAGGQFMLAERCRLSLMHRVSRPIAGQAYEDVAQLSNISQLYLGYVPSEIESTSWFSGLLGNPEMGIAITRDSGLFLDADDQGIETWFASLRFRWATGLIVETWNDFANGTDFGPSFGLLISVDLATIPYLRLFR